LEAAVRTMFAYRPAEVLAGVSAPIVAVRRITRGDESTIVSVDAARTLHPPGGLTVLHLMAPGHNLPRYRPDEVTAAILGR
ncbi:MAG TPA: hypothetical protein VHM48_11870, partial [Candidatus Limnocylindrales bacterium]|nr:hypothetical protein [Candidatus Limnocylindrales bacterium]